MEIYPQNTQEKPIVYLRPNFLTCKMEIIIVQLQRVVLRIGGGGAGGGLGLRPLRWEVPRPGS